MSTKRNVTESKSLANRFRPNTLNDVVGQERPVSLVRTMLANDTLASMVFYGPPGCGKTTIARIIANSVDMPMRWLNATTATIKDLKTAIDPDETMLVYLDEIQYWNKKQQQSLLSFIEDEQIVLIAATTENPWHSVYDALLSRMGVVEFSRVPPSLVETRLVRIKSEVGDDRTTDEAIVLISRACAGDMRRALTLYDMTLSAYPDAERITPDDVRALVPSMNMASFDQAGDAHYGLVSALQKSIRGSDPDAAVFYLCRFLAAGDLVSPCRRLPAICCEDIGLADPHAITHTMECIEAAEKLGLPEAYKPLTQAVIYLALAPKCASNEAAWMPAKADIEAGLGATIPSHIASEHAPGYVWPQDKPRHWTPQQYLPDDLIGKHYWVPQDNDWEQERYAWWWHVSHGGTALPNTQPKL